MMHAKPSLKPLRILLADDHVLVRAGIRSLLNQLPGVTVVAEAADGREALKLAALHRPDVALFDVAMPGLNGIEATLQASKRFPTLRVIILSMHSDVEYVRQAFRAGAAGYLLKRSAVAELKDAIQVVAAGQQYLSPVLAIRLPLPALMQSTSVTLELLTPRQRQILQLIAESRTTKEIAHELGLSTKTVEFHRAALMKRLGIFDIPGLVRYSLKKGMTRPEM
jgi:DNA-binding NarL/FixJ family response regulator